MAETFISAEATLLKLNSEIVTRLKKKVFREKTGGFIINLLNFTLSPNLSVKLHTPAKHNWELLFTEI